MGDPMVKEDRSGKEAERRTFHHYMVIGRAVFFTAVLIIIFYFCVKRYDGLADGWNAFLGVLSPFIAGIIMAFLMNPTMNFLERHLDHVFLPRAKKPKKVKHRVRVLSATIAVLILIAIIGLFLWFVIPQVVSTLTYIYRHLNEQIQGVVDWANRITGRRFDDALSEARKTKNIQNFLDKCVTYLRNYLNWDKQSQMISDITTGVKSVGHGIVSFLIGIVAAIYMLSDKDKFRGQSKEIIYGIFPERGANVIMDVLRKARDIFNGFIVGKIIDSAIIGVICYVCMLIFRMPYPVLVSVIVGVTNVIPVFGPYIGAVPTVIIIFFTNPMQGIYYLIFIIVLQQIDGNIIGPKILGDSTGISAFWVLVSIVIGGGLFGFLGMLLGVPTMALIYYIVRRLVGHFARKKGLPGNSSAYTEADHVENGRLVMKAEASKPETEESEGK